ncbi:MAG TPA: hypothetical protein VGJ12_13350 [Gemmatimonadaceae bacterium]
MPIATLLWALVPALAATAIVVFFFARPSARKPKARADGLMSVELVQKDSAFNPIPASKGGATGQVLYRPSGPTLHFVLHAVSLPPGHRYELEIQADTATYEVASFAPDPDGRLTIDTTLTEFREGECVGTNFDAPRSLKGLHIVKFRLKRAGSPATGTMPGIAPSTPGAQLPCHGNGDGNYGYALFENATVEFRGTTDTTRANTQTR